MFNIKREINLFENGETQELAFKYFNYFPIWN